MDSVIEEIKQRLDIVDVISSYIKLEKAGANYRALCPFHSEKKPSFFVSPARQIWHCFGACNEGGDIFKFVMKIEGVEFGDALRILAKRAGVELKPRDPVLQTARKRLYDICEIAAKFFEKQLSSSKKGSEVKEYLYKRGIKDESIYEWRLGYAPDVKDALSKFLKSRGFKEEEIIKAGLAVRKDGEGIYDRFRSRIIFPIFDLNSQVIGFGGRIFGKENEVAKYMNIPNTLLYDKSKVLYGLNKSKMFIRQEDNCVLVEGYIDAIMSYQAGAKNVVAVSGTALTPFHLRILKRYTNNLTTSFDMDIAGNSATKRGIDLAQKEEFNIRIVIMPKGLDPADIILQHPEDWENLVKSARSIMEFYFESAFSSHDASTAEGKKEISNILIPVIANIPNKIEQSHWIGELSKKLGVPEKSIEEEINRQAQKIEKENSLQEETFASSSEKGLEYESKSRKEKIEQRIFLIIFTFPEFLENIKDSYKKLFSLKGRTLCDNLIKEKDEFLKEPEKLKVASDVKDFFDYLWLKKEIGQEILRDKKESERELKELLNELKKMSLRDELESISQEIKKLEGEGNKNEVQKLVQKFNELSQELLKLQQYG
ncbi:DNA primase [bacterium]|nr:DNA primase [bacterium]